MFVKKIFLLLFCLYSLLFSKAQQIWMPDNTWYLTSYKGVYTNAEDAKSWEDDPHRVIEDIADTKFTYIAPNAAITEHQYNTLTGLVANMPITNNTTTEIGSTVGLFAIKGASSPLENGTILDGTSTGSIKMKVTTIYAKNATEPMYSMYIGGGSQIPAVRIIFQGDYQGDKFRIKFGNEENAYIGVFDYRNTFDEPVKLEDEGTEVDDDYPTSSPIKEIFDFNITDNSIESMINSTFSIKTDVLAIDSVSSQSSLKIHHFNSNGVWEHYNSGLTNANTNAFTSLEVGKAYWVKVEGDDHVGLITSQNTQIKEDYLDTVSNGWNLLMFDDSYIRYSTTGVIFSNGDIYNASISINKPDGRTSDNRLILNPTVATLHEVVREINSGIEAANLLYGLSKKIRAFAGALRNSQSAVIILSDELMYFIQDAGVPLTNVTTLTGEPLIELNEKSPTNLNVFSSRYGEYLLVAQMNNLSGSEINATVKISTPSISSTDKIATDLNDTNNTVKINAIFKALEDSSKNSAGVLRTSVNVTLIDIDVDALKVYTPNNINSMNYVLLASGERFSISDATYIKAYKYLRNGDFRMSGSIAKDIRMDNLENMALLETQFDNEQSQTDIDFQNLGVSLDGFSYFAISSNKTSNIDLLENEENGTTLFEEITLNSTVVPDANRTFMKGAISKVYTIDNLLNTKVDFNNTALLDDRNTNFTSLVSAIQVSINSNSLSGALKGSTAYVTNDLRTNVIWSLDFPLHSIVEKLSQKNKKIDAILTSSISNGGSVLWQHSDLTKDPEKWYGNSYNTANVYDNEYQGVFSIKSNKGYWVKISNKTVLNGSITQDSIMSTNVVPHFDNDVQSTNNPISKTSNDIHNKLILKLDKNFIDPLLSAFYDVIAIIDGTKYHLRTSGNNFELNIKNREMNLLQKEKGGIAYSILIEAHDGLGNVLQEKVGLNKFNINFTKPETPKIVWTDRAEIEIINKDLVEIQSYINYISDVESFRVSSVIDFNTTKPISNFKREIGWDKDKDTDDDDGLPSIIKIVAKDKVTSMYSDALTVLYAPLKFGHILEVNVTDLDYVDTIPYSFIQNQYLTTKVANSTTKVLYDGSNGINGGVQLNRQLKARQDGKKIKMVYFPSGGKKKESSNELSRFGGSTTMYIKIKSSDRDPIASITYIPNLIDSIFYLSYNKKLYIGRFSGSEQFSTDASSYLMGDGDDLTVDILRQSSNLSLGSRGRRINNGILIKTQPMFNGVSVLANPTTTTQPQLGGTGGGPAVGPPVPGGQTP